MGTAASPRPDGAAAARERRSGPPCRGLRARACAPLQAAPRGVPDCRRVAGLGQHRVLGDAVPSQADPRPGITTDHSTYKRHSRGNRGDARQARAQRPGRARAPRGPASGREGARGAAKRAAGGFDFSGKRGRAARRPCEGEGAAPRPQVASARRPQVSGKPQHVGEHAAGRDVRARAGAAHDQRLPLVALRGEGDDVVAALQLGEGVAGGVAAQLDRALLGLGVCWVGGGGRGNGGGGKLGVGWARRRKSPGESPSRPKSSSPAPNLAQGTPKDPPPHTKKPIERAPKAGECRALRSTTPTYRSTSPPARASSRRAAMSASNSGSRAMYSAALGADRRGAGT
jgi:hypothetical protein